MVDSEKSRYRQVTIQNELGLHARAAAQIAKLVENARAPVWLKKGDETVDASSIVDILTLACEKGSTLTVIIENPADMDILTAVSDLVDGGFGE
jgi:phosphocarrier protein